MEGYGGGGGQHPVLSSLVGLEKVAAGDCQYIFLNLFQFNWYAFISLQLLFCVCVCTRLCAMVRVCWHENNF